MPEATTDQTISKRREHRPGRIDIGTDVLVRNDLKAQQLGMSERTLNRGDAHGAPFVLIGNVKYRPDQGYNEFIAARIQRKNTATPRRRRLRSEARDAR
jgi:hypothetical protein